MDGMNGWMNKGWVDVIMNNVWRDKRVDGWVGGWMDGWVDGWMDGWIEQWMDGGVDEFFIAQTFLNTPEGSFTPYLSSIAQ